MSKLSDMDIAVRIVSSKARAHVLAKKLSERQLNIATAAFSGEHENRRNKQVEQEEAVARRPMFFDSIQGPAAAANIKAIQFVDHNTGKTIKVGIKSPGSKKGGRSSTSKINTNPTKYFVSDKDFFHCVWDGRGHIPPAFKAAGCNKDNKKKFLSENVVVLRRSFPESVLESDRIRKPGELKATLAKLTPNAKGKRNVDKIIKKINSVKGKVA